MKNNHKATWKCIICEKLTQTLHEIFFGSWQRKKSIEYNLQVPVCPECHNDAHKMKTAYQEDLCDRIGLPDRFFINRALQTGDKEYLELLKPIGSLGLKRLEI